MDKKFEKKPTFIYRNEIKKIICNHLIGAHDIDHFSINVMLPDQMIVFSSNIRLARDFQLTGYEPYFKAYSKDLYENNPIYAWDDCYEGLYGNDIRNMITNTHGLHSGTMIIRRMPTFSIMYSVATKNQNPRMRTKLWNLADYILKSGDIAFNELRKYINECCPSFELTPVNQFVSLSQLQTNFSSDHTKHIDYLVKYNSYGLTKKEIECIRLIRLGKTAKEIATLLHRSTETIKTHLKHARYKMSCASLSQLVAESICCGLIK